MPESTARDACDLLDADHLAVKHLFVEYARLAHAPAPVRDDRVAIAHRICDELGVHAQIEEEIFYPALVRAVPAASDLVEEGTAEHQEARQWMDRIRGMGAADEGLDEAVSTLARLVAHHVKEERDELFPKARVALAPDLERIAQQLRQRQQALQQVAA